MTLLTSHTTIALWQDVIKSAQSDCSISLNQNLEVYLISLLMRYSNKPDLAKQLFAKAFLDAMQLQGQVRIATLQHVGDQCLLYAGLYPQAATHKLVKINYFVDLGRSAYAAMSQSVNDLYWSLAIEFIALMDVLQSIRAEQELQPLQAYEQWNELGSKKALLTLQAYTKALPLKKM